MTGTRMTGDGRTGPWSLTGSPGGRLALIGAAVAVLLSAACSLPVDERVTPIDRDEFGDQLTEDTTTTTTTTTTVPATTVPDDTTVASDETTTTVATVPTETVTVFYTRGSTDVMQPVEVVSGINTPIEELVTLLERPADSISDVGFLSAVRPGLIDDIGPVDRGVATVSLDPNVLDIMSESARQQAIAQIVLTVTSFRTADAGNIGRVRFEVDGEGFPVFVPALGGASEPGEELAFTDFQSLIATTPTPTTTVPTTTTTTTTTTVPESWDDGGGVGNVPGR